MGSLGSLNNKSTLEVVQLACKVSYHLNNKIDPSHIYYFLQIYDRSGSGNLTSEEFKKALYHTLAMTPDYATEIFHQIDRSKSGCVSYGK